MNKKLLAEKIGDRKSHAPLLLTAGVVGMMLFVANVPVFILLFLGTLAFFFYKASEKPALSEAKEIFEFYLAANDILRDDDRRWFGFEIQEVILRGERIIQSMPDPPPLIYFSLGALYHRNGSYKAAVDHLSYLAENETSDEKCRSVASPGLRNYVKLLRKIEAEPNEAPKTSAAIRALERGRRNRINLLLEESRKEVWKLEERRQAVLEPAKDEGILKSVSEDARQEKLGELIPFYHPDPGASRNTVSEIVSIVASKVEDVVAQHEEEKKAKSRKKKSAGERPRQSISEVLRDIYDSK